jgi:hypothetical protein
MADLKPLGSEKLNGDDKLKRILELTYFNNNNKSTTSSKAELVKESKTGGVYGVVKEKDGYYVKRGLNESSLDYIGGMFMKNKNKFSSYSEAYKRLELLKGQEELQEATKYVLKQPKPQAAEAPMPEPAMDLPAEPMGGDVPPAPAPEGGEAPAPADGGMDSLGGEGGSGEDAEDGNKRSSYMAEAQKYAGKLGQELRDLHDKMESDDIKYILNMIISAVDLDKLDDDDIEEIGKKFEREEDELGDMGDMGGDDMGGSPEASAPEEEIDEYDSMSALESFIDTPMDTDEIDLSKYAIKEEDLYEQEEVVAENGEDDIQEIDLDEIKSEISRMTNEILSKHFK